MARKDLDVVIHGAAGFTGRLIAEYAAMRRLKDGLAWGLSGRNLEKLAQVRDEFGFPQDTPLIRADADDQASLDELAASTTVVLSAVGPYQFHGSGLIEACARAGAAYVDLCGEPAWMRRMIDLHEQSARDSGARIVFSCGFDSVPSDLGVLHLQGIAQRRFGRPAQRVKARVTKLRGGFSGGTVASLNATLEAARDPEVRALLRNPFSLTPGFSGPEQPRGSEAAYDEAVGGWTAPFVMAPINTRNVHRSNALLGHRYGADFVYDEMLVTGPGERGETTARALAADGPLGGPNPPKPGEGPDKAERESGGYEFLFIGEVEGGGEIRTLVTGERDPGYGSTSRIIAECAAFLAADTAGEGGIWTPASAMGEALIPHLANAGLVFRELQSA